MKKDTRTYICDRCYRETQISLDNVDSAKVLNWGHVECHRGPTDLARTFIDMDLCPECTDRLAYMLTHPCSTDNMLDRAKDLDNVVGLNQGAAANIIQIEESGYFNNRGEADDN